MVNTWEDLEKLEENWDSYHGAPIDPRAIENGKYIEKLLIKYFPDMQKFPTANGGIEFEDDHHSISIAPDGQIDEIWSEE